MKDDKKIALKSLSEEKYGLAICYPTCKTEEFKQRLRELRKLNIRAVEFTGQKRVSHTPVLGKGCVGIVVKAYKRNRKVALKIRRTDADRVSMRHEAQMLKKANSINIGPRLLGVTENFLLMEYVEGILLPDWIETLKEKDATQRLRRVLCSVLKQAWRLDKAGLDHGELSHAPKHIIVRQDDSPCLVDFETASTSRHVSNVTSLCQYLFIGSLLSEAIHRKLGRINRHDLINALRTYKKTRSRENFRKILRNCKVLKANSHTAYNNM